MRAGELTKRAALQKPHKHTDADGQIVQGWQQVGVVWCNLLPLRGSESVMQARMESRNPAVVTVRSSSLTRPITAEWQVVIDAITYAVKEAPRETQDRGFLEFLAEAKGSHGMG